VPPNNSKNGSDISYWSLLARFARPGNGRALLENMVKIMIQGNLYILFQNLLNFRALNQGQYVLWIIDIHSVGRTGTSRPALRPSRGQGSHRIYRVYSQMWQVLKRRRMTWMSVESTEFDREG
jgi:hypothetical protein